MPGLSKRILGGALVWVGLLTLLLWAFSSDIRARGIVEDAGADNSSAAPAGPAAAPEAPEIRIEKASSNSIALLWDHPGEETTAYQVWRSENPYFDPNIGQGAKIDEYAFPGVYGQGTAFRYVDNGSCGYFLVGTPPSEQQPQPCTSQNPTVTVLGDVAHNYFWAVRGGNTAGEFDFANRVGEFDYRLVPGS
jgi:hypothetical protein